MDKVSKRRFQELEEVIEDGLDTFIEVGNALAEIRDSKLYKAEFSTFKEYCEERWELSRSTAYELIEAAKVVNKMSDMSDETKQPANVEQKHYRQLYGKLSA